MEGNKLLQLHALQSYSIGNSGDSIFNWLYHIICYDQAMARIARVIAPGIPHHATQRGNRRQQTFFTVEDYEAYLALMAEWCAKLNKPLLEMVGNWKGFLALTEEDDLVLLKKHERSGRPLGETSFVEQLETDMERQLRPGKRGPKPKTG
jgi:hypothetical protein